jgi:drug/metabolite transporter (DMT)-like permease
MHEPDIPFKESSMESRIWIFFVVLAGLCWGAYVPFVAAGGKELKSSYASLVCVGVAYFLIAIIFPLIIFWTRGKFPDFNAGGTFLASMAGVAGALGAVCVILATIEYKGPRIFVAPLIFALAPLINTIISLFWHPEPGKSIFNFGLETLPHWTFYIGIVFTGLGAGLVLFSKEYGEMQHAQAPKPPSAVAPKD